VLRGRPCLFGQAPCHAASALKTILTAPGWSSVFLAGMGTGFITVWLVYAFLLKAGRRRQRLARGFTMALFGLEPSLMVLAGSGGSLLSLTARTRVYRLAAWCVVFAGAITVARGANQLRPSDSIVAPCPLCAQNGD
jgi:sulfite exporter TauE/SafE